jgi:hypothetical protein
MVAYMGTAAPERPPPALHLPLFTYNEDLPGPLRPRVSDPTQDTPFAFSAFFQPSEGSSPGLSVLRTSSRSILREEAESFFIGFSWGPTADAFPDAPATPTKPVSALPCATSNRTLAATAAELVTPIRRVASLSCASALRRTRTAPRRIVSDREAMRQLVDCIGLSARKKVLAAGRTPRSALAPSNSKTLRFATYSPVPLDFDHPMHGDGASIGHNGDSSTENSTGFALREAGEDESDGASASDAPPSPSPSPRPGSAMSMLSRRSATPTASLLPQPPLPRDTHERPAARRDEVIISTQLPPPPLACSSPGEDDTLGALEERHRALMGDIASIEGRVGAMKRRTH